MSFSLIADGRYKIYHTARRLWDFPYTVTGPDGHVEGVAATRWGAMRVLRKAQKSAGDEKWWDCPIVYAEAVRDAIDEQDRLEEGTT